MNELLILSRAVHFGACLVLLAVYAVRLLVDRQQVEERTAERGLAGVCVGLAAGSGFLWFWVAAAGMSGSTMGEALNTQLFEVVLEQTAPGQVWKARGGIGAVLGILLCFPRGRWRWRVGAVFAAAFTGSLAWLGHAGAETGGTRALMLTVDVVHLLAASLWPAGLLPFALLVRRLVKAGALPAAWAATRRFSTKSLVTVAVLATSGFFNACFLVGSLHALVTTNYGRLLMVKLGLFLIAVTVGAWNLLVHKPRLETAPHALAAMRRKVWIEAGLGALIVVVVAIMGTLPPGSSPGG